MQRTGFDALHVLLMQTVNVRMRVAAVKNAEPVFAAPQAGAGHIAGEEDRHRQLQVAEQQIVQRIKLL